MNIHEYQAKELLQKFDVATTRGRVAATLDEAEQIARELGDIDIVVKAQIHAGGPLGHISRQSGSGITGPQPLDLNANLFHG